MGMASILVMWPGPFEQIFSPILRSLHMKFEFIWPSGFEEKMFENVDGGMPESLVYYKLT